VSPSKGALRSTLKGPGFLLIPIRLLDPFDPDAEVLTVIPAKAGIQEKRLVPDFRRDDVWTPKNAVTKGNRIIRGLFSTDAVSLAHRIRPEYATEFAKWGPK
jgi:hypothetical protein